MNRSEFLAGAGTLLASALIPSTARAASADDAAAIQQLIIDDYHTYYVLQDMSRYRPLLADDYLLLENGELFDLAADLAFMPKPEDNYRRTDRFEFHQTRVVGDAGWVVYTLRSDVTDRQEGHRQRNYLESAVMRRTGGRWLVALLHSTLMAPAAK
jgi:ketosteroid isomerase-like protein